MKLSAWQFLLAVFTGRIVRFGVEAALTVKYGPQIVDVLGDLFKHHLTLMLVVVALLLGLLFFWVIRKLFKRNGGDLNEDDSDETEPSRRKRPWL